MDVRGGKPGNSASKVGLKFSVGAVGEYSLLEGVDLTHNLCYAPLAKDRMDERTEQHEMGTKGKEKS